MGWPHLRGSQHGRSKFTEEQIIYVIEEYIKLCPNGRREYGAMAKLAEQITWMSRQNIQFICQGKAWPHVTQPRLKAVGLLDPRWEFADCDPIYQKSSPFWENMNRMARLRRQQGREETSHD
jgi:hypothetical protein